MSEITDQHSERFLQPAVRYTIQRLSFILIFGVILFIAAGKLSWFRGWVYLLYGLFLEMGTLVIFAKKAPETLNHRDIWWAGVKSYDKVFAVAWVMLSVFITPFVAGIDERFRLFPNSIATFFIGIVLLTLSTVFSVWAMLENEHFEQFMRIQEERTHRVVTSGPYRIVRHPGYAGAILGALSMPLVLGLWWTYIPAGGVALLFVIRTVLEDRTLRRELKGYEEYTQQTCYLLIPGIW